ncbi:MAG: PQQ-binding-like beta-propeller repeat protein, partial [Deltaproteobacteria bacterium]|nr:PQQ-binding-like beta-propeller repeat protein [Deltaproteobacteria bacterium]
SLTCPGCGSAGSANKADTFGWVEEGDNYAPPGEGGFNVRWSKQLTDRREARYVPVELATASFDPRRERVYIGTTDGNFFAFRINGRRLWLYDTAAQIESQPAVDDRTGQVYVPSTDGLLHALDVDGNLRWKTRLSGALRTKPVLTADALYIVGENDIVTALARDDGRVLWSYEKEPTEEITISGHAGLLLEEGRLYAAFTDGAVAAINPYDGRLLWEIETATDVELRPGGVPRFLDVNTTPVLYQGTLLIASFTAGLYALDATNGTVEWRDPTFTGVTGLAVTGRMLIISSARRGVLMLDLRSREVVWEKSPERGAPTPPVLTPTGTVIYGETQGSLLALALSDGREVARAEGGSGFSATPAVSGGYGGAISNGGRFLLLRVN